VDYNPERLEFAKSRLRHLPSPISGVDGISIGRNCSIDASVVIGKGTVIQDNVVIIGKVKIGDYCLIKPGTVIGCKGFSYGMEDDMTPVMIGHNGGVVIGSHVEIGAACSVCQGTIDDTVLGDHVKLDDNIHIAHNCHIGQKTVITAGVIFGGSVVVGVATYFGLNATVKNKLRIGDFAIIGMGANVIRDVGDQDVVAGNPAKLIRKRDMTGWTF
jgi:UDP-3-O-[3-hydroxymyristoyl] glucosamine N-acyltransferase